MSDENYIKVLDHGFVGLIDTMGDDDAVVQAARVSYGSGTKTVNTDRNLIRYLMRHKHTTPFEMCEVKFHIKLPIFVMRQLIRHRTAQVNEYSGRYSVMSDNFYVPELDNIKKQSKTNKQGRDEDFSDEDKDKAQTWMESVHNRAHDVYHKFIKDDMARETARAVLPVSNYTEAYWKCNMKNFLHMVHLRADSHAQWEIQEYANAMYDLVKPKFPIICEAWEDYAQNAVTFSGPEMKLLKEEVIGDYAVNWADYLIDSYYESVHESLPRAEDELREKYNLSKRELEELKTKIGCYDKPDDEIEGVEL
jgi:thymidylate synthase (FAD)